MTEPQDDRAPARQAYIAVVRNTVWNGIHGVTATEGPCYVCQSTVNRDDFVIGHYEDGVIGGKAQVKNMRPICDTCDHVIGKTSIAQFLRTSEATDEPGGIRPTTSRSHRPETHHPAEPTPNRRWFNAFLDSFSYNASCIDFDIPIRDISFPDFDLPDIDFPDFDFDFDFDF